LFLAGCIGKTGKSKGLKDTPSKVKILLDTLDGHIVVAEQTNTLSTSQIYVDNDITEANEIVSFCSYIFDFPDLAVSKQTDI